MHVLHAYAQAHNGRASAAINAIRALAAALAAAVACVCLACVLEGYAAPAAFAAPAESEVVAPLSTQQAPTPVAGTPATATEAPAAPSAAVPTVRPLTTGSDAGDSGNAGDAAAPLASAPEIKPGVYVIVPAKRTGAALDVAGASSSNGAKVQLYAANRTVAQRWRVESAGNGTFRIVAVGSGKVLDVAGGKTAPGTKVQLYASNNTPAQKWKIVATSGGYALVSALSDTLALGTAGNRLADTTSACVAAYTAGAASQVWRLQRIDPVLADGAYVFTSKVSGKVLDVAAGSVDGRANVQQYGANGTIAQRFFARFDTKTGYYTLYSANSGLVLDAAYGSTKNGGNVWLYAYNNTAAQKWDIATNADGSIALYNAKSGLAMDVAGGPKGNKKNGANVQIYAPNATPAQAWSAAKQDKWLPDGIYCIVTSNNASNALAVAKAARSSGANIASAKKATTSWAQAWAVAEQGSSGYYTIRNLNSRMALTAKGSQARNGTTICQEAYSASAAQLWRPVPVAGGIIWQSKIDSQAVLDLASGGKAAGTNVQVYARNNTAAQKFRLKELSVSGLLKGQFFVVRNVAASKVLDVKAGSTKTGAAIQLYAANGTAAQKFSFVAKGGSWSLVNEKSGCAIDAAGGSALKQQKADSRSTQRFAVSFDTASATFAFKSNATGKYLDGTNGALSQHPRNNALSQQFVLVPTAASDYFRVYINAGHGWNSNGDGRYDSGAVGSGLREADLCSELAGLVIKYGRELYGLDIVDGRPHKLVYTQRLNKAIDMKCSAIFSIHFDAGGGSGPMTMVGVSGRHPASPTFNNIMQKHLYAGLPGLPKRGTTYRNDIYCVNGNIPAVLAEVCFVDNATDMNYYRTHKDQVARELAAGLYEASKQSSLRRR